MTNATSIPLTVHWSPLAPRPCPDRSIPVALVTDGLVKTQFALRFRLKLGCATFRCGLHSAKHAVPPSAALPLANIQTEADSASTTLWRINAASQVAPDVCSPSP